MTNHCPVLLREAIEGVAIRPEGRYIDATFGRGGHTREILKRLSQKGQLMVIDLDLEAIAVAKELNDHRVSVMHGSYARLAEFVDLLGWTGSVDGILMDLGVSSPQLDTPERGFSFMRDGPLDMRMNTNEGVTACEWLASAEEVEIAKVLWEFGEERLSRRIARAIVREREKQPITRTAQLAAIIAKTVPAFKRKRHPATKSFQAIRIFVNRELEALSAMLAESLDVLRVGGRLSVITFHSLEDRIVKRFIAEQVRGRDVPRHLPISECDRHRRMKKIGGSVKPTEDDIRGNARARSARLRVAEKIE